MKVKDLYKLLLFVPALAACQSEDVIVADIPETPGRKLAVRATLPGEVESRTHITYGNQDTTCEFFRWHPFTDSYDDNDYITVFNVTKASYGIALNVTEVNDKTNSAVFESADTVDSDFKIEKGDVFFASYWHAEKRDRDGGMMVEIPKENKPQIIVEDPTAEDYMTYMQGSLKMYDIMTAEEDDKIPDIHFKHMSALMRITFRNETGHDLLPKSLKFDCPGSAPFYVSSLYCGVDRESLDGSRLVIYNESEYSDSVKGDINNYTAAGNVEKGGPIAAGKSYELYVPVFPRGNDNIVADQLIITLEERLGSGESVYYPITLDPFGVVFEAGQRYWFNLTAVEENGERKLMFTNQWLSQHPEQKPETGE